MNCPCYKKNLSLAQSKSEKGILSHNKFSQDFVHVQWLISLYRLKSCYTWCSYLLPLFLQRVKDDPMSEFIKKTRDVNKSIIWKFFHDGENENDMICELCPNGKIIRHNKSTFNLRRHLRRKHTNELKKFSEKLMSIDN